MKTTFEIALNEYFEYSELRLKTTTRKEQSTTRKEEETTSKREEETTSKREEVTTSKREEVTTSPFPSETTTSRVEADITISFTKGASVANVLVTFSAPVPEPTFRCWWYAEETDAFTVHKNSDTSYSIKVNVPSNYKGKLLVGAYNSDGSNILRVSKIINNK